MKAEPISKIVITDKIDILNHNNIVIGETYIGHEINGFGCQFAMRVLDENNMGKYDIYSEIDLPYGGELSGAMKYKKELIPVLIPITISL